MITTRRVRHCIAVSYARPHQLHAVCSACTTWLHCLHSRNPISLLSYPAITAPHPLYPLHSHHGPHPSITSHAQKPHQHMQFPSITTQARTHPLRQCSMFSHNTRSRFLQRHTRPPSPVFTSSRPPSLPITVQCLVFTPTVVPVSHTHGPHTPPRPPYIQPIRTEISHRIRHITTTS